MTLKKQAFTGIYWSLIDKVINQLFYALVIIFLANKLGPEAFGLIGMLTVFVLMSESIVNCGFAQALVQRSKKVTTEEESTVFYINLFIAIVLYLILFFVAPYIAIFYNETELIEISRVLFLALIINAFSIVPRAKLTIKVDFRSQAIANSVGTIIGSIVAVIMASHNYGYWALVGLSLVKGIGVTIGLWIYSKWRPKLLFCLESFKRLFKFGSNLMIAGLTATIINNLYLLLIGRYFTTVHVGYFSQATMLTNSLSGVISSTLQGVTYPILTSINDDRKQMVSVYKKLIEATVLVSVPVMVGFAAVADEFTRIFLGTDWLPIIPVIIILSFARLITPISGINLNILNAIGRSDLFLRVDLIKLPMAIITLLVSVSFGILAVAWGMLITSFISFFINAYYPGKLFGFGAKAQLQAAYKIIIAAIVMYLCTSFVKGNSIILTLVLKVLIGIISYVLMLYILKVEIFMKTIKKININF